MTVGMVAVGKVYVEALIIAYGEGRNGKSTFWNTISRVLGTYSGVMSADSLTANCRRNVKPEIAELKEKRLIIAAELGRGNEAFRFYIEAAVFHESDPGREDCTCGFEGTGKDRDVKRC